jgi:ATPases with chaperone activity, ATP-binding subunit
MFRHTLLNPNRAGKRAEELRNKLRSLIIGQNEALDQIVDIYQMHLVGLSTPGRPIGNFLFLGPTGSGKTRTVEATAEALVQNPGCATAQQGDCRPGTVAGQVELPGMDRRRSYGKHVSA